MCGIVGIVYNQNDVVLDILQSLKRLEYRGYDSSGIAIINKDRKINLIRETGKIENLINIVEKTNIAGNIGLGHTRWATHGKVSEENSHPHTSGHVAVVHNGIIENYAELKKYLIEQGENFTSETDTEVIPVFINFLLKNGMDFENAFKDVISKLRGAYAIAAICTYNPDVIAVAKNHSPLVVGYGDNLTIIGSDAFSVISLANKMVYLLDGDYGFVNAEGDLRLFDSNHESVHREIVTSSLNINSIGKDGYKHYMLKEINEQPEILQNIVHNYLNSNGSINLNIPNTIDINKIKRIKIIACGTSYYSGQVASTLFEKYAQINTDVYIASEYRYRNFTVEEDTLYIAISQSGETADTIGSIKAIKEKNGTIVSIVNTDESTIEKISDFTIKCHSGPEIGVASTKVFTSQILTQIMLCLKICREKKLFNDSKIIEIYQQIEQVIKDITHILSDEAWLENIQNIAKKLAEKTSVLYIGRSIGYAIAMEGALKLKELSYIHAEGMASGELKHGSIALIDKDIPVIAIANSGNLFEKNASNIENVLARDGRLVLITDEAGQNYFSKFESQIIGSIKIPESSIFTMPLLYSIPIQLLAYHVAVKKGNDVDQPRNLAKSVTVE